MFQKLSEGTLFDEHGRLIPVAGWRVFRQISRRYFRLNQPAVNPEVIFVKLSEHLNFEWSQAFSNQFVAVCNKILGALSADKLLCNLVRGVHVPFICPPIHPGLSRAEDLSCLVAAAGRSFRSCFLHYKFYNRAEEKGKPGDDLSLASGSHYEQFEQARELGFVAGWYFPNCLSEYDLTTQRRIMATLPENVFVDDRRAEIVLSGGAEAAAAIVGCPDLLYNEEAYPHHLCLSALTDSDERFFYSFEAYGKNLVLEYRTNMLIPTVTQVSEQFAGGLTVFMSI